MEFIKSGSNLLISRTITKEGKEILNKSLQLEKLEAKKEAKEPKAAILTGG